MFIFRKFESIWSKGQSPTLAVIEDWSTSNARVQVMSCGS